MATPLDPKQVVATSKRVAKPNPDTSAPKVGGVLGIGASAQMGKQYVVTQRDGTEITYWEPDGGGPAQEISRDTDPDQAKQWIKDQEEARKAAKDAAPDDSPKTITAADGSVWQYDPSVTDPDPRKRWVLVTPAKPKETPAPDKPIEVGGQLVTKQPDGTYKPVYTPEKPAATGTVPALNLGNARTGQRTDLTLVESEANAYIASLNADKTLTPEERTRRLTQYIEATVKPAVERATAEVNAEAARVQARQVEQDARAAEATALANRREDRATTTADRAAAEATRVTDRQFAYTAGQDAVANAMKLMPYRVGPGYNDAFAGALNSMGGRVSGRDLDVPIPDFAAIARRAASEAYAIHGAPVAPPGTPAGAVPPGLATLPVAASGYVPPAPVMPPSNTGAIAPVTSANRDRYYA